MAQTQQFDLTIIGSGPGGYVGAIRASQIGLRTALVERSPRLGGTCLNVGCIPTKALLHSADLLETARAAGRFGVRTGDVQLDLPAVHKRKAGIVRRLSKGVEVLMRKNGVTLFRGQGRLENPGAVRVTDDQGASRTIASKHILLATGSSPKMLPGLEIDGARVITSTEALDLDPAPGSLVILGAGAVGVEFASIYSRFGSRVTLVEMLPRILPIEDDEISAAMQKAFKKRGIGVRVGSKVEDVEVRDEGVEIMVHSDERGRESIEGEVLLVAVGREPRSVDLGLEGTKVEIDRGFVKVDRQMRTGEPTVFAVGDLLSTPALAHVASHEAIVAVEAIAGVNPRPLDYDKMPGATYGDPEVASIGLTERAARERGHGVRVGRFPFPSLGKAGVTGVQEGFVKLVGDESRDELLGVHIIGPKATELIGEASMALQMEATVEDLFRAVHAHPTLSEAMGEAALDLHARGIHL